MRSKKGSNFNSGPYQTASQQENHDSGSLGRFGNWMFRDRTSGRITIVQRPNALLIVFVVAKGVAWFLGPSGWLTAASILAAAALVIWAGDEIIRGVNPWRRALGVAILGATLAMILRS